MSAFVLAAGHDTHGKRDASAVFVPEAKEFCRLHGYAPPRFFDNRLLMKRRKRIVLESIAALPDDSIDVFAFFGHGWRDGIQAGIKLPDIQEFADVLASPAKEQMAVVLYCCDTGRDADDDRDDEVIPGPGGSGGFADKLRHSLLQVGIHADIWAHSNAAHATWNPYVRRFARDEVAGGRWVVEPKSPLWLRWRQALRQTDLRFRFWQLTQQELEDELRGAVA